MLVPMETDLVFVTVKDLDSLKSLGSVCTVQQLTCVELISGTPEHQRLASDMDAGDQLKSVLDGCYPKLSIFDNTNTQKHPFWGQCRWSNTHGSPLIQSKAAQCWRVYHVGHSCLYLAQ